MKGREFGCGRRCSELGVNDIGFRVVTDEMLAVAVEMDTNGFFDETVTKKLVGIRERANEVAITLSFFFVRYS